MIRVILSDPSSVAVALLLRMVEAKNLACGSQMLHLRFSMTTPQTNCDRTVGLLLMSSQNGFLISLSFEEHHKSQYAHKGNRGGHKEDGSPLELAFFSEFVHYNAGNQKLQSGF
jgi:hypothetical protein